MSFSVTASMRSFPLLSPLAPAGSEKAEELSPRQSIEEEFLEIARKSPAERLRDKILEELETSEEALAQMDAEARTAMEVEIKRQMMEQLQVAPEPGQLVDKAV